MGVVYKLKKEIIDFIVGEKQANPGISCRKLSDLIREKFQAEVSKSSVNAVIKQANLSSPVGRRAGATAKPQGFQIPKEKKIELNQSFSEEATPLLENQKDVQYPPAEIKEKPVLREFPAPVEEPEPSQTSGEKAEKPLPEPGEKTQETPVPQEENLPPETSSPDKQEAVAAESESSLYPEPGKAEEIPSEEIVPKEVGDDIKKEAQAQEPSVQKVPLEKIPEPEIQPAKPEEVVQEDSVAPAAPAEAPQEVLPVLDEPAPVKEAAEEAKEKIQIEPAATEPPAPEIAPADEAPFISLPEEKISEAAAEIQEPASGKTDDTKEGLPLPPDTDEKEAAQAPQEEPPPEAEERPHLRLDPIAPMPEPPSLDKTTESVESVKETIPPPQEPTAKPVEAVPAQEPYALAESEPVKDITPSVEDADKKQEEKKAEDVLLPKEVVPEERKDPPKPLVPEEVIPEKEKDAQEVSSEASQEKKPDPDALARKYVDDKIWTPGSKSFHDAETPKPKAPPIRSPLYDNMGCFFLKGAEWELSSSSILGGLLNRYVKGYMATDVNMAAETVLYLTAFGMNGLKDFESYNQEGLWVVNNITQKPNAEVLSKLIEGVHDLKSFSLSMSNEYSQLFSETSYIKVNFQDGTDICFDAQMKSIWYENNVQTIFSIPLNKSFSYLSNNLMSNVQPVIIFGAPGYKSFSKQFYDMALAFSGNFPDKNIVKISIFDSEKSEIAKFVSVPVKKRYFITGIWPWQEECKRFIEEDLKIIKEFRHEALGRDIYYSELKKNLDQPMIGQSLNVRVGLIRETGLGWPVMGIMTNMDDRTPMEDIISMYLSRWPNGQEGHNDFSAKTEKASYGAISIAPSHDRVSLLEGAGAYSLLSGSPDFWVGVKFLLSAVNGYCQRHFFPPHYEKLEFPSIRERFYSLSGYIEKNDKTSIVTLAIPPGYGYLKDLEYAVARFNESDIRDPQGMKLLMKWQE